MARVGAVVAAVFIVSIFQVHVSADPSCPDAGAESHTGCEDPIKGGAPFDMWELARSWTPGFCASGGKRTCSKKECAVSGMELMLTLHGMWPSYSTPVGSQDSTSRRALRSNGGACFWPQDCSKPSWYPASASWSYDASLLPKDPSYEKLAPAWYDDGLGVHEWSKHGTCAAWFDASGSKAGLDQAGYYQAMFDLATKEGTPDALREAAGGELALSELQSIFGGPKAVALGCTSSCQLVQVLTCYAQGDTSAGPAIATECPCTGVRDSHYDNSCAEEHACDTVKILSPDQTGCGGQPGPSPGPGPMPPSCATQCCEGYAGPDCAFDADCKQYSNCLRCAHSGHCTDVPLEPTV